MSTAIRQTGGTGSRRMRRGLLAIAAALAATAALVIAPGAASANIAINDFSASVSSAQAGGHPDIDFHIAWGVHVTPPSVPCHCDDARIIIQHFPTGFIGNPHAVAACTAAQLSTNSCPVESQVGVFDVGLGYIPVYNMETAPDQAGLVAFVVPLVASPALIELSARTESDYGLDATSSPIFHILPIPELFLHLWGVPADHSHDQARFFSPLTGYGSCGSPYPQPCAQITGAQSSLPPVPYLENPTECGVALSTSVDIEYYTGDTVSAEAPWPSTTGCDQLAFNPSLTAQPLTTPQPGHPDGTVTGDSASGLDVDLTVPQTQSPTTPSPSEIRATAVTLPEGFSINPNAADGKVTCSDADGAFGTRGAAHCPEHSKVGTVTLDSSALPQPISGGIFLGEQKPGEKYRLFLTADGFGTHVKLAGVVKPDPQTGQLVVSFPNLPQSPFQEFAMHFFGSERGLLATPTQCGTYPVQTEFVPWDAVLGTQHSTSFFKVDTGPGGKPCPGATRPFGPRVTAGTTNNTAGKFAPFVLDVQRDDGDQNLTGVNVSTPPGFSASLRGIPYCPESALATLASASHSGVDEQLSPACPEASQIGTATTSEGAGTHPLFTPGKVYLAGPYKGAPMSLVVVIPAVSGPYDLGNVVVRSAIHVDSTTAQITTVSDPIPTILDGIPLRLRQIQIRLDRPSFTLNPTSCNPFSINTQVLGSQGAQPSVASHFQVANCPRLDFGPRLGMRLSGPTKRNGHPGIHATLAARSGDANIGRVAVTLPRSEQLDQSHLNAPCTRAQFAADACPDASRLGQATATTPLLGDPLSGPVYLVTSSHGLPDLVARLHGQIDIDLRGQIDTVRGGLRTRFNSVPDVPVSGFSLDLLGGAKGLVVNNRDICAGTFRALAKFRGQNGRKVTRRPKLRPPCGSARHRRHLRHNKRHKRLLRARKAA